MPTLQTKNLTIQYRQAGAGAGSIPLVFIHGNYASSRWWLPQLERLPANVQAFAPDLRGCGSQRGITRTLKPINGQLSIQDLTNDLAEFFSALNLHTPILVGHSLGGVVATEFAVRFPGAVRGLLLEDTGPPDGVPSGFLAQSLSIPLEFGSKLLMRNALRMAGIPRRGELARALVRDAVAASPGQYLNFTSAVSRWNVENEIPSLDIPILLVWGDKDRIMPPRIGQKYLRLFPRAELVIIPDVGHSPHLERPDAFAGLMKQFIDQCASATKPEFADIAPKPFHKRITRWMRTNIFNS